MARKAITKRIKITGTGKMLYRKQGKNHFNAKESRRVQNRVKKSGVLDPVLTKKFRTYLNQT